jgi:hypothetical protein
MGLNDLIDQSIENIKASDGKIVHVNADWCLWF